MAIGTAEGRARARLMAKVKARESDGSNRNTATRRSPALPKVQAVGDRRLHDYKKASLVAGRPEGSRRSADTVEGREWDAFRGQTSWKDPRRYSSKEGGENANSARYRTSSMAHLGFRGERTGPEKWKPKEAARSKAVRVEPD